MASRWARTVGVLAFLALVGIAHGPLVDAGLSAADQAVRADVARALEARGVGEFLRELHGVRGSRGHLLPGLLLLVPLGLAGSGAAWAAHAVQLVLSLLLGLGLALFLRRLLRPWVGREPSSAMGGTAFLFFALHPASGVWLADLSALGDLLAGGLGLFAAWTFLRGRQERRPGLGLLAGCLAILAGFASPLALLLPLLLGAAEFVSSRRWRPERVRWRTALTTLVVFGGCVSLQALLRSLLFGGLGPRVLDARWQELTFAAELPRALGQVIERVGVLVLPVLSPAIGLLGFLLGGAFLLVVMQPGLQAARSAPRMWGWQVVGWLAALAGCELLAVAARVTTHEFSQAHTLVGSGAVVAAGLAALATSVSGGARRYLPWVGAVLFAVLAHAVSAARRDAALELRGFVAELELARETFGREARLWVLDPPAAVRGIDLVGTQIGACFEPLVTGRSKDPSPSRVRSMSGEAFLAWAREDGLLEARSEPWVVSVPAWRLEPGASGRRSVLLPEPEPSGRPRRWSQEGRSPALDLDPRAERELSVRALTGSDTSQAPVVFWRADASLSDLRDGSLQGTWLERSDPPMAIFDLSSSFRWLLAGRARLLYPNSGWGLIEEAQLADASAPPSGEAVPRARGADWLFELPAAVEGSAWRLQLLDLAGLELAQLPVEVDAGTLRAPSAARRVGAWLRRGRGPVAWTLERLQDGVVVERARGRRVRGAGAGD